jgi:Flp pilus assembly protein TadG
VSPRRRLGERGSATLEMAIVTPALVMLLLLVVLAGRLALAYGEADNAARDAARAASIARSATAASSQARQAAAATLANAGISCRSFAVATDTSAFQPGGAVTVQVACTATLSDLGLLGVPGSHTLHGRYTAPLDQYRGIS